MIFKWSQPRSPAVGVLHFWDHITRRCQTQTMPVHPDEGAIVLALPQHAASEEQPSHQTSVPEVNYTFSFVIGSGKSGAFASTSQTLSHIENLWSGKPKTSAHWDLITWQVSIDVLWLLKSLCMANLDLVLLFYSFDSEFWNFIDKDDDLARKRHPRLRIPKVRPGSPIVSRERENSEKFQSGAATGHVCRYIPYFAGGDAAFLDGFCVGTGRPQVVVARKTNCNQDCRCPQCWILANQPD